MAESWDPTLLDGMNGPDAVHLSQFQSLPPTSPPVPPHHSAYPSEDDTLDQDFDDGLIVLGSESSSQLRSRKTDPRLSSFDSKGANQPRSRRFTSQQKQSLKTWFLQNTQNPYPSTNDKTLLAEQTGLTTRQVEVWFSNARKRRRKLDVESGISSPGNVSASHGQTPLERYLSSSEDEDAISPKDISRALAAWDEPNFLPEYSTDSLGQIASQSDAPSNPSLDPQHTSYHRVGSASSIGSAASFGSRQGRRRHGYHDPEYVGPAFEFSLSQPNGHGNDGKRSHRCSYCSRMFNTAYDCRRHENSSHLGTERWVCMLHETPMPATPRFRGLDFLEPDQSMLLPSEKLQSVAGMRAEEDLSCWCPEEPGLVNPLSYSKNVLK
ncbi:MAG: hypothetical protein Q9227_006545 [Pyrenula ochraceoflavens]